MWKVFRMKRSSENMVHWRMSICQRKWFTVKMESGEGGQYLQKGNVYKQRMVHQRIRALTEVSWSSRASSRFLHAFAVDVNVVICAWNCIDHRSIVEFRFLLHYCDCKCFNLLFVSLIWIYIEEYCLDFGHENLYTCLVVKWKCKQSVIVCQ